MSEYGTSSDFEQIGCPDAVREWNCLKSEHLFFKWNKPRPFYIKIFFVIYKMVSASVPIVMSSNLGIVPISDVHCIRFDILYILK